MSTRRAPRDEFERGCMWAAWLLGPSFGLMIAAGILMGW